MLLRVCGGGGGVGLLDVHRLLGMHMCVWGTQMCVFAFSCVYLQLTLGIYVLTYTGVWTIDPFTYRYTHVCVCVLMGAQLGIGPGSQI